MARLREGFEAIETAARGDCRGPGMLAAKRLFYDALFEGAANSTIQEIVEGLQARVTVLRRASLAQPGRSAGTVAEVRAIVEALEARDGERAAAACVHHVNEAARTVFAAMANAQDDHEEAHTRWLTRTGSRTGSRCAERCSAPNTSTARWSRRARSPARCRSSSPSTAGARCGRAPGSIAGRAAC